MELEATIELNKLHDALEALSAYVDEAKFVISRDGITSHMRDPANVAEMRLNIKKEAFLSWSYEDVPTELALIDLIGLVDKLAKLREVRDKEEADFTFDEGVSLRIDESTNELLLSRGSFTYRKHLADPDSIRKTEDIPIKLPLEVRVKGAELWNALHLMERDCEYAIFELKEGKLIISGKGKEVSSPQTVVEIQPLNVVSAEMHNLYSMDYLSDLKKPLSKADVVTLHTANEFPITFGYSLHSGSIEINYMLAPREET